MAAQRWKITIEYDGSVFAGWQRQEQVPSVQQAIEDALAGFCQQDITVHGAGRTDAGVHARGQVAHFDLDYGGRSLSAYDLAKAINAHLRDLPVAVLKAEEAAPDFHARFSALMKTYTYRVLTRSAKPTFEQGKVWHHWKRLDVAAMREGAKFLTGHHDFTSFRDSECQGKSPEKTLDELTIEEMAYDSCGGYEVRFHARARSFLHHQVRNMVGTLALVGEGKWTPADIKTALDARDRRQGGPTAPPDGLYLVNIEY